jgi:hypothetical protein
MQAVSGQQLGKHFPAAKITHATIEELRFLYGPCREVISVAAGASRQRGRPTSTSRQLSDTNKKNLVESPRWGLYSKIDWPT